MSNRSKILTWGLPLAGAASLMLGAGFVVKNRPVTPDEAPPRQPTTAVRSRRSDSVSNERGNAKLSRTCPRLPIDAPADSDKP